jgi:ABC-type multidrug transport system fused ATPase/permease subunit
LLGQVGFVLIAFLFWKEGYSGVEITAQIAVIGVVVTRVLPAVNRLNAGLATLLGSLTYVEGLLNILDSTEKDQGWLASGSHGKVPIPKDWKTLQLQGAGFGFGEGGGIWDLDIELKRGNFYGVVGRSGAGKSTLLNLLLGLIEPTQGRILIDGVERQRLDPAAWLDQLAYVPQDVFLLDDTLEANIIFGTQREDATVCMGNALKIASLDTLIPELPEGMATRLGERGRRFSGGQAQRVAIARAMFNRPTILLMDEATSALDSITERDVQNAIAELGDDTLVIAISHRVSSLKNCDDIIVVDAGRIADVGSYDELMQRNHLFADLAANTEESPVES